MEVIAPGGGLLDVAVDHESVHVPGRPADGHPVPLVVRQRPRRRILNGDGAVAEIERVVQPAVDQLDGHEVAGFARVVQEQAVLLEGAELKSHVDRVVGLHLRQAHVGALGGEGHGVMHRRLGVRLHHVGAHEVIRQLPRGGQVEVLPAVDDELLHGAHEVVGLRRQRRRRGRGRGRGEAVEQRVLQTRVVGAHGADEHAAVAHQRDRAGDLNCGRETNVLMVK